MRPFPEISPETGVTPEVGFKGAVSNDILVLQHGEIRERGSHRELLALRGLYYRLYQLQLQGQEVRKIA